jgi:hypothetical protein
MPFRSPNLSGPESALIIFLLASIPFATATRAQTADVDSGAMRPEAYVYPFGHGGLVGLMDGAGRIVVEPRFQAAGRGGGSVIPVQIGAGWGLWSAADSALVLDARYDAVVPADDGIAMVRTASGWGLRRYGGEAGQSRSVSDAVFHAMREPADGVFPAAVAEDRGPVDERIRWGVFSTTGDTLVEPRFEDMLAFNQGLAAARISRRLLRFIRRAPRWGYVGPDGEWLIDPEFDSARSFSDGRALVSDDGELFFVDTTGARAFTVGQDLAYGFSEGRARVVSSGMWGWIDTRGTVVVEPTWEGALDFSEGLAAVRRGTLWGYVDRDGRVMIPPEFDRAGPFRGPLAPVVLDGRRFYIDRSGSEVAPVRGTRSRR